MTALMTKEAEDLAAKVELLEETLRLMISYLGHQDQDANHQWMVRKMNEALAGKHPAPDLESALAELADMDEDRFLDGVAKDCRCCSTCSQFPCPGVQQGAPCDAMCHCADDEGPEEAQSRDDLDAEGELP